MGWYREAARKVAQACHLHGRLVDATMSLGCTCFAAATLNGRASCTGYGVAFVHNVMRDCLGTLCTACSCAVFHAHQCCCCHTLYSHCPVACAHTYRHLSTPWSACGFAGVHMPLPPHPLQWPRSRPRVPVVPPLDRRGRNPAQLPLRLWTNVTTNRANAGVHLTPFVHLETHRPLQALIL